jgi:hypothetical protein
MMKDYAQEEVASLASVDTSPSGSEGEEEPEQGVDGEPGLDLPLCGEEDESVRIFNHSG